MEKIKIAIYDFDKTVYKGETSIDFWLFLLRKKPLLVFYLPYQLFFAVLFGLNLIKLKKLKEEFFVFIYFISDEQLEVYIEKFWQENESKINDWFYDTVSRDRRKLDLIGCISASPDFLLKPILSQLNFDFFLATEFCREAGEIKRKIKGENCKHQVKVKKLRKWSRENNYKFELKRFYSDSMTDLPLYKLADQKYVVKNGKLYQGQPLS